jgi:hypothetical protein
LITFRRLDSEMKMELARRLDAALMEHGVLQDEIERLKWDLSQAASRAAGASGGDGSGTPSAAGSTGSIISQGAAKVTFTGVNKHPQPYRPAAPPVPPAPTPAAGPGLMHSMGVRLGLRK